MARSISSVGLYVPGGTAVLPSTALMLAIVRNDNFFGEKVEATKATMVGRIA